VSTGAGSWAGLAAITPLTKPTVAIAVQVITMAKEIKTVLDRSRQNAGLSQIELWRRYFALGGMSSPLELEAVLDGILDPGSHDHDLIAHALNERFVELGGNHPVPYLADGEGAPQ
jgi:hypothetical protein